MKNFLGILINIASTIKVFSKLGRFEAGSSSSTRADDVICHTARPLLTTKIIYFLYDFDQNLWNFDQNLLNFDGF